ncbi:MAG: glycoside hydrolase family 3 C-terminal domain-containing protein, partial [Duncaniella sp.]|nr:glycoside hydrolase family 3 C-terminal domain-containing protein [Duncaniella sp.]
ILPLAAGKKILVTGPNADSMRSLNGGWSYTWQGDKTDSYAAAYNTIQEAMTARFGADNVTFIPGLSYDATGYYDKVEPDRMEEALAAAAKADVIVACIGENSYCETPGNLTDLHLNPAQRDYVKRLAETGKPIVLILNEGRPRLIADIEPLAAAVVDIIIPGNYGGDALASLLAGDANFSGKLPFTYPREINSLVTYDYKVSEEVGRMEGAYDYDARVNVQWPFGYGRSYTTFSYANLRASSTTFSPADNLTFSIDVTNTGSREGKEAVLLYSSDLVASIVPDNKRLRAFEKIELKPGETRTVTFTLPASDLAFVGADGKWVLEEGDFVIAVGTEKVTVNCTSTRRWEVPNI